MTWTAAPIGRTLALSMALLTLAGSGLAQTVGDDSTPDTNLDIPQNLQIFGKVDPNIRKPTALVNGTVITGTDVDQRTALVSAINNVNVKGDQLDQLRLTILRQLVDEVLEIQEAKSHDITVTPEEITLSYGRLAKSFGKSPAEFSKFLVTVNSSEASMKRQVEADLAWQRYLRRRVEPLLSVSDQEVQAMKARIEAAKGMPEYHLKEIYIAAEPTRSKDQAVGMMKQVFAEMQQGKQPFDYFARTYSDATTKAVGGDLDWVRASVLPDALAQAVGEMKIGQIAGPIEIPGGFSLLYLVDKRQVLTADPRDARLSLKQLTLRFPSGTTEAEAQARAAAFGKVVQGINGCGSVEKTAATVGAEVVGNDQITIRDLPPQLQDIMLKLQIGQSTPPFGSAEEGVRALVLCGRDDPQGGQLPTDDQLQERTQQMRVNLRAQQLLRDLRRDAIIEYR